jgi:polyhydroxyalkanoate synthesis regulator phasin
MDKKSEVSLSEYRKLALRYKTLEAQLRQTIPKKEHNETVTKLERQVDGLEKELDRSKADLQKYNSFGKQIGSISDSMVTQGKATAALNRSIESLAFRMSQGSVPASVHAQALARVRDLEEQNKGLISKAEYDSLNKRCEDLRRQTETMVSGGEYTLLKQRTDELAKQISVMVPGSEYATLKQHYEELENAMASLVPRAQLESSEARVNELEARLAERVPQAVYDELVGKVVALAEEVTGGSRSAEEQAAQNESAEEASSGSTEPFSDIQEPIGPDFSEPTPQFEPSEIESTNDQTSPEISEVQAQLAEISSTQNEAEAFGEPEAQAPEPTTPAPEQTVQSTSETY